MTYALMNTWGVIILNSMIFSLNYYANDVDPLKAIWNDMYAKDLSKN